tara:strand:- start:536 stop:844 length:309 start_codon:yes stop_codon:yes gene_type:complete
MNRKYPSQAVPRGTFVRSKALDRLGVVTDAFVEDEEIIYTCFIMPNTAPGLYHYNLMNKNLDDTVHGLMTEESEFDLIFYLMIGPVDLDEIDIFHAPGDLIL